MTVNEYVVLETGIAVWWSWFATPAGMVAFVVSCVVGIVGAIMTE